MSIKKEVIQLQKHMYLKFPKFNGKFYSNRNFYIQLGLDKSLFSFENYKTYLEEINSFLSQNLKSDFKSLFPPKHVISTKCKHDYIIYVKNNG